MLLLVFLSSGLFLGWSLGANDAANIFGSAVGSKMVRFRKAAWVASIFVILGAVFQGRGAADTLSDLGAVDALAGGFTVALCAAVTVFWMTRYALPVSTSQAIVGAIIGWSLFAGQPTNYEVLSKIVSTWISGPVLGALFSAILFLGLRKLLKRMKMHVIRLDVTIRIALLVAGAFGAYSLGANNIANVMGVFIPVAPDVVLDFGIFTLDGVQLLFLLGGIAISAGIFTYGEKVMHTVGNGILALSSEAALVVVLSQALVLFVFSSAGLSQFVVSLGLPAIPLVPVSSTQVVVGSVVGIGLVKGAREIRGRALAGIALGWLLTPLASGLLTYLALFFVQNVFHLQVSLPKNTTEATDGNALAVITENAVTTINLVLPGILILASVIIIILVFVVFRQQKLRLKAENELLQQQSQFYQAQKALSQMEISAMQSENQLLNQKLETRLKEYTNVALSISSQKEFFARLLAMAEEIKSADDEHSRAAKIEELSLTLKQKMSFTKETQELYTKIDKTEQDFRLKLSSTYPGITEQEKKLAVLLRLNLSSKEISSIMGISAKSVEIARYRLRQRLKLKQGENLITFIQNL
jgi:phosphate/sulfate permease/DNA-binding CsgD family transcriptional regulator